MIEIPMVRIGKLFFSTLFFVLVTLILTSKTAVTLEVRSVEGVPITQVGVGCICDIRVTLQASDAHKQVPKCILEDKDQHFKVLNTTPSHGISIVNGIKKHEYTIALRVQACKSGIAYLKALVNNEQSNSYSIPVTEPLPDTLVLPSCELIPERTDLVVGETVPFVVRLYTSKLCYAELQATHALPDALIITNFKGSYAGLARQGNNDVFLLEWHGCVTARQEGVHLLPELLIQYKKPRGYFSFLGYAQSKRLTTAPVQFTVCAVPTGTAVQFIGKVIRFTGNLEKTSLMQGQATTFTLTFEGIGNTDMLIAPQLCLPQELSYYAPHCTREQLKEGYTRVTWNYVLQAHGPGSLVIPAQDFTWFDTQERTCKQLHTDAYTLTVTPAPEITTQEVATSECTQTQEQEHAQDDLASTITNILAIERAQPALAWLHFYVLLFMPFGLWLFTSGTLIITSGRGRRWYYYYTAYWRARRALHKAQKKQQVWRVYAIIRRYIADRLELDQVATPTYEHVCAYLCSCAHTQFTQEECEQWRFFLQDSLYSSAYAPCIADTSNNKQEHTINNNLFTAAYTWLVKLGRIKHRGKSVYYEDTK